MSIKKKAEPMITLRFSDNAGVTVDQPVVKGELEKALYQAVKSDKNMIEGFEISLKSVEDLNRKTNEDGDIE